MAPMLDLNNERHAHIAQRLQNDLIVWLTTVRPDGRPHAVAVWFLWDGEAFFIFSKPDNQKIRNLRNNASVVLALDNTYEGSDPITIEGKATLLRPDEGDTTGEAYVSKYGEHIKEIGFTPEGMAVVYSQGIRILPTRFS